MVQLHYNSELIFNWEEEDSSFLFCLLRLSASGERVLKRGCFYASFYSVDKHLKVKCTEQDGVLQEGQKFLILFYFLLPHWSFCAEKVPFGTIFLFCLNLVSSL